MARRKSKTDSRSLFLSKVKKNYRSLITGFTIFSFLILASIWIVFSKINLTETTPQKPKQEKIKGASTTNIQKVRTYIVLEGDSLSSISFKFYGDYFAWEKIAAVNNIVNPDLLEVGDILIIP